MNERTAELEKNELAEWVDSRFGSLRPHLGTILLGILALVLAGLIGSYWFWSRREASSQPWRDLQVALVQNMQDSQASHFELIADQFPNTIASLWALQLAGDSDLRVGLSKMVTQRDEALRQIDRAVRSFEKIQQSTLRKPDLLIERSTWSHAYALESLGRFDEARKLYQRLLDTMPQSTIVEQCRDALARLDDPAITGAFTKFSAVGTAPGTRLPPIPDISFPDAAAAGG